MRILYTPFLIAGCTVAVVCNSTNVKAEDTESTKAAYELFEAMEMATTYEQTIARMVDVQTKQNPQIAPFKEVMLKFFDKHLGWESMKADMAKIYTDKFTTEELIELKSFYETPIGKKAARLLPELTAEGAALGQKRVQQNMGELQRMIAEEASKGQS